MPDAHTSRVARSGFVAVRDECMGKLFAVIGEYHGVSEGQIREWTGRRNLTIDLPVFLAFVVGFSLAARSRPGPWTYAFVLNLHL